MIKVDETCFKNIFSQYLFSVKFHLIILNVNHNANSILDYMSVVKGFALYVALSVSISNYPILNKYKN